MEMAVQGSNPGNSKSKNGGLDVKLHRNGGIQEIALIVGKTSKDGKCLRYVGCYNYVSTAIRPRYDHSTTYVTTGLLHCDLNKYIGQRDCG